VQRALAYCRYAPTDRRCSGKVSVKAMDAHEEQKKFDLAKAGAGVRAAVLKMLAMLMQEFICEHA